MILLRKIVKKLARTNLGILLKNSLKIRSVDMMVVEKKFPISVSDAFLWRTDKGFKTIFKYSDILSLFYKIKNSWVEFHFYTKNNELIKIVKVDNLNLSNELEFTFLKPA